MNCNLKKRTKIFKAVCFFKVLLIKTLDTDPNPDPDSLEMLDWDPYPDPFRIQLIRIHYTGWY